MSASEEPGLWIPNTETDDWDPSDPEEHTRLLITRSDPKALRVTRARAIRLAKAENRRTTVPPLCSFNLEALGLMFVERGMDVPSALLALWEEGARDLDHRYTPDPAGVSKPIKVLDRPRAIERLEDAAGQLALALDHDDDEAKVRAALRPLWPDFIAERPGEASKARPPAPPTPASATGGASAPAARSTSTSPCKPSPAMRIAGSPWSSTAAAGGPPGIYVDGPSEVDASPHRYADRGRTRLCVWYPGDPADRTWVPEDGLLVLFGMITEHLFKEAWWREHGEWLGEEYPHDEPAKDHDPTGASRRGRP